MVGSLNEIFYSNQLSIQGFYNEEDYQHNRKPVYKHIYHDRYIYFNEILNENNSTFSHWAISHEVGRQTYFAYSLSKAPEPTYIGSEWMINNTFQEKFVSEKLFQTRCVSTHFDVCSSQVLQLEVQGIPELDLQVFNLAIGTYELLPNITHNLRPVYKHTNGLYYLYYKKLLNLGFWSVGRILGGEFVHFFIEDYALNPEFITNSNWDYLKAVGIANAISFEKTEGIMLTCHCKYNSQCSS